jgi:hypothetical protein
LSSRSGSLMITRVFIRIQLSSIKDNDRAVSWIAAGSCLRETTSLLTRSFPLERRPVQNLRGGLWRTETPDDPRWGPPVPRIRGSQPSFCSPQSLPSTSRSSGRFFFSGIGFRSKFTNGQQCCCSIGDTLARKSNLPESKRKKLRNGSIRGRCPAAC